MDRVPDEYTRPYDPFRSCIRLAEKTLKLLAEVRLPLAPAPGQALKVDPEDARRGTATLSSSPNPPRADVQ